MRVAGIAFVAVFCAAQPLSADELFDEGRELAKQGDYAAACDRFERSFQAEPADGTELNLADCHEHLGHLELALDHYHHVAESAESKGRQDRVQLARARAAAITKKLAEQRAAAPCACDVIDRGKGRRRAAKLTALGGVALWGSSLAVTWYARSKWADAVARLNAATTWSPASNDLVAEANHAQNIARLYGTGLFAAGTIALSVAAFLYVTAPGKEVQIRTALVPSAGDGVLGLTLTGGF